MHGSTHFTGGMLAGAVVGAIVTPRVDTSATLGAVLAYNVMAAVGPAFVAGLVGLVPDWFQVNIPGANNVARGIVGHRGLSHWLLSALALGGAAALWWPGMARFVLAGYLSHLVLDLLSGGMAILWPWPGRIKIASIKTGSTVDVMIGATCFVLSFIVMVWRFR